MSIQRKVLIIGDEERAPYHPLNRIEEEIHIILGDRFCIEKNTAYDRLSLRDLKQFELCISYADCWKESVSDSLAAGLTAYVEQGGALLVIHNGISLQVHEELYRIFGARFTGHPPYQTLNFRVKRTEHPVMRGISSFSLAEEPYQYEFHPQTELDVLMEYEVGGQVLPAAWVTKHGGGKLIYVMPGHHAPTFRHPVVRDLIRNCADWLCASAE